MKYVHPYKPQSDSTRSPGVAWFKLPDKPGEDVAFGGGGVPDGLNEITYDFDEFFARLKRMSQLRQSLKIPLRTYHAWYVNRFFSGGDVTLVWKLLEEFRHKYEMRVWANAASAKILLCIADELGEEAGGEFYDWVNEHDKDRRTFVGFGCPAWWEFTWYGVPIMPDWHMEVLDNGLIKLTSPDEKYIVGIGS